MGCMRTVRSDRGLRGGGRNDRWRASLKTEATSVAMAWGEVETLRALVEMTILFLMTLMTADKAGIIESWMRREEDGVGLVEESFPSVRSLLGFLDV